MKLLCHTFVLLVVALFPKDSVSQLSKETRQLAIPEIQGGFPDPSIVFTWPQIGPVGRCTLSDGATLALAPDGHGEWNAVVSCQTDDGDVWLARITLLDDHGLTLWQFGQIQSPRMDVAGRGFEWSSENELFFPAYPYPFIARVNLQSHC
jgi:Family of unknown function (DUF6294)